MICESLFAFIERIWPRRGHSVSETYIEPLANGYIFTLKNRLFKFVLDSQNNYKKPKFEKFIWSTFNQLYRFTERRRKHFSYSIVSSYVGVLTVRPTKIHPLLPYIKSLQVHVFKHSFSHTFPYFSFSFLPPLVSLPPRHSENKNINSWECFIQRHSMTIKYQQILHSTDLYIPNISTPTPPTTAISLNYPPTPPTR